MGLFSDNIGLLAASSSGAGVDLGHPIENSCRFNDDDSAYLSRTFGTGNRKTWTYSVWMKRGNFGAMAILGAGGGTAYLRFNSSDQLEILYDNSAGSHRTSTAVFRDPSAWYNIVFTLDTTNATDLLRGRVWVNGIEITSWAVTRSITLNGDYTINSAVAHEVGRYGSGPFDGYMAEVVFIDGQALDSTSFGEFNSINMWVPKNVSGLTYGTNGFHLDFADSGDIGNDVSGNANDFTPNNLAAGDILIDTPTNNFATLSSIDKGAGAGVSDGNLHYAAVGVDDQVRATIHPTTGKWYWEANANPDCLIGISLTTDPNTNFPGESVNSRGWYGASGAWFQSGSAGGTWATYTSSDVLGFALDSDAGTCAVYKNNVLQGTWTSVQNYVPVVGRSGGIADFNFGQSAFAYTPPTGFQSLCTENLGTPTITDPSAHFDVAPYTGNGTAIGSGGNEISDLSFQPDLVWIKNRDAADYHVFADSVTGAGKYQAIDTSIEFLTTDAESIASFDADGFTVGNNVAVNTNTEDYVAWCWKKGATSGVDVVNYTGDGNDNRAISHSLGVIPEFAFFMYREAATYDAYKFVVMPTILGTGPTNYLDFGSSGAENSLGSAGDWLGTVPDWNSSTFSVGTYAGVNESGIDMTTVLFASVEGFSKIGSYIGNGNADGPFVWCGFRPKWMMLKPAVGSSGGWWMLDSVRNTFNLTNGVISADATSAESFPAGGFDITANGFKLRTSFLNTNGATHIFIAFAEHPFAYARAR